MSKFRKLVIEAIQHAIISAIWLVGAVLSVVPFMVIFNVDRKELDQLTFFQNLSIVLLLTACFGISLGLFLFYQWLAKRWSHNL